MRVLVVDPHPVIRAGLRAIIESAADLEWAGEAADPDAVDGTYRIDAAVVNSPVAAGRIAARHPAAGLLLLTAGDEVAAMLAAIRCGVRSFISDRASPDDVVRAIRAAGRGETLISADLADALLGADEAAPAFPALTRREHDVGVPDRARALPRAREAGLGVRR